MRERTRLDNTITSYRALEQELSDNVELAALGEELADRGRLLLSHASHGSDLTSP